MGRHDPAEAATVCAPAGAIHGRQQTTSPPGGHALRAPTAGEASAPRLAARTLPPQGIRHLAGAAGGASDRCLDHQ